MICLPVSDTPVAITYLDNQKGESDVIIMYQKKEENEAFTYQKEKEDEVISYQNNNMEDEDTKYVVSKFTNPP